MWLCEIYSGWVSREICNQSIRQGEGLPQIIEEARQDWIYAQHYFNSVTEPELLDYGIYMLKAAELKYTYLLKRAKKEGIRYSRYLREN